MYSPKLPFRYHVSYKYKDLNGQHEFHSGKILSERMIEHELEKHVIEKKGRGIDLSLVSIIDSYYYEVNE